MLLKNDNIKVSFYIGGNTSIHNADVDLCDLLKWDDFKEQIENIRKCEYHSAEYNKLKLDLPIFTAHATYKYGDAKTNKNAKLNSIICVDIDYKDNKELIDKITIEELKFNLIGIHSVVAVALSCGGHGLMVFHRLDDKVTKDNFNQYAAELEYLYNENGIVIDDQCYDPARRRYITYDPNVLINQIYEPYSLQHINTNKSVYTPNIVPTHNDNINSSYRNWKINPDFDINNYKIDTSLDIEGFNAIRRKWLATTIKRFFNVNGLQLAIDIYKSYPNSVVKQDSIEHLKKAYQDKPACIRTIATDLVKLGILIENKTVDEHVFNLNENEYLYDVINKIKFNIGFNLLVAGTGYGKTEVWKKLADKSDVTGKSINNVLVCEPRNSIIMSKYIDEQYEQVYGNMVFPTTPNGLVVTNYDKLIKSSITKNFDWFANFDFFVIDESHLLFSESYRDNTINKFIDLLINIKDKTRIIFQTATPTDENDMFNISKDNIYYVNKSTDKKVKIEYIDCYGDLLYNAEVIAKNALDSKKYDKVFIYNGTGSVISDEALKKNLVGKYNVLVYHRKSQFKDTMKLFDEQHKMKINYGIKEVDYDIFIASTAASVGIDINDECSVLVIIIGNITFEEEMQVAGRFRKCKDMGIQCLIGNSLYNNVDWYKERKNVFNSLTNILSNNEIIDSNVINNQLLYGIKIGNIKEYNQMLIKYFEIKNNLLRSAYKYKVMKYEEYGWEYNERIISKNIFEALKHVDGFELGKTEFKLLPQKKEQKYKEVLVNGMTYRLYGDKEKGWILCKKYYDTEYVKIAREYRKDISNKNKEIKEKLLSIIKDGNWKDDYYKYKEEYPLISGWIDDIVRCYRYHNKLFNMCDDDILLNNSRLLYVLMRFIDFCQKENYDWVEWFIIKLCRENRIQNMCGYAYLLWCLYTNDINKNKMMKISFYDSFSALFNMLVYELSDDMFEYVSEQIDSTYTYHKNIDFEKLNDEFDIFNDECEISHDVIDVLTEKVHISNYYTKADIKKLIEHIDETNKAAINSTYDMLYKKYKGSEYGNGRPGKKVIVTDKMKQSLLDKYKLSVGDEFETMNDLCNKTGIRNETATRWFKTGLIQ